MNDAKAFIDSNVIVYLFSGEAEKADRAEELLSVGASVSVQVLNEVTNVARRKLGMSWEEVDEIATTIQQLCEVEPLTADTHNRARQLAKRYSLSFFDAVIAAAALIGGCDVLYSEDMHHGALLEGQLRISNPFISGL